MKQTLVGIFAVALLAGCGRPDAGPEAGPGGLAGDGVVLPADTAYSGADGIIAEPGAVPGDAGPDTPVGSGPVTGGQPSAPTAPGAAGGGSAPSPGAGAEGGAQPAHPSADGAAILRRASAAYENVRSLQADFVMNFENPLLRQRLTSRGTLYQRQPDRIALRFSDPAGDLILGDGQYFYMYQPSNNPDQYFRQPAAAAGETGVNLQAQFVGNPVERFNFTLEGTESVGGRGAHVLNLVPRQRADYRSLKVWIDDRDSLVRRFELTEHNGSIRRFDLQNMQVNPTIPDAVFRFTPPPGARAVAPG
jgi:outer membrane lipoprotein carrier protein